MVKTVGRITEIWALAGGILLIAIVLVTSWNVGAFGLDKIARTFGSNVSALPGYEDFVRLTISMAALMFFPYCQFRRGHVAVDLLVSSFSRTVKENVDRVWLVATAVLAVFLLYWMIIGIAETRSDGVLSPVLGWPEWPFYLPGIVSLFLWTIVASLQATVGQKDV